MCSFYCLFIGRLSAGLAVYTVSDPTLIFIHVVGAWNFVSPQAEAMFPILEPQALSFWDFRSCDIVLALGESRVETQN